MRKYTLILITIIFLSCDQRKIEEVNFQFYPSFLFPISYKIDFDKAILHQNSFEYNFMGSKIGSNNFIDKSYKIKKEDLNVFLNKITSIKLDSSINNTRQMLDGTGLKFSLINAFNDTISLTSSSPGRVDKYKLEYELLDALFELAYKTITDYEGLSFTENIQDRFDYGLPIKKVNDDPLEYRVWGSITGCRENNTELITFLNNLPNETVIIDKRNGSFSFCLQEVLDEFKNKKEIYYYGFNDLNQYILELKILKSELGNAEKYDKKSVGRLRVNIRENKKTQQKILNYLENNENIYLKRKDVIKTIANNVYN